MKDFLLRNGVRETQSPSRRALHEISQPQSQLASMSLHVKKKTVQSPEDGRQLGLFGVVLDAKIHRILYEVDYAELKAIYEAIQDNYCKQWYHELNDEVKSLQKNES